MRVHLILLLVSVCLATSHASPQRNRQGERDSVLTMGMKFLGNMRERVTGLFRPRSKPAKGRPQRPPPPQHLQPQSANQIPKPVTPGPSNSNFAVVHEEDVVTRAAPAPHTLPLQEENDSFQPSSFFNNNRPFQGFKQETNSAPKRPNDFGFGNPKDQSKFVSSFSRETNTRPSHQNSHSSGFQQSPGIQSVSPPNFSNNAATGFTQFGREAPVRFRSSSSSPSSPSSLSSSPSSPSSAFAPSSSFSSSSSGSVANKPQNHLPPQDNHIPEIFTVPDPQRHESNAPKEKFRSNITPSKPSFTHRLAPTRLSTTTRRVTPTRPTTKTPPFVVRPSRLPSAAVPSQPKKPLFPAKPGTGDRHINTGFKQTVTPKDGNKAAHIAGYEWGYGVLDSDTGNQFFHAEKREEGTTKGSYKIQLPDGRIQTVTYTADDKGYHPIITYEGEAKFPDARDSTNDASDS